MLILSRLPMLVSDGQATVINARLGRTTVDTGTWIAASAAD
jgi:hypothetical protein